MEKPLVMIYVTHMFVELSLLIQVALIPVIVREFQLNFLQASLIVTIPSFVALLMNIPCGILADRFSANRLLFASLVIEGVSAILVSQTSSFWVLVLAVSLLRISSPVFHVSGLSQISLLVKPERISRSVGFNNAFGSVGSAMGVITLTIFLSTLGWRWTYLFWSTPILIWSVVVFTSPLLRRERVETDGNPRKMGLTRFSFIFSAGLLLFLIVLGVREIGATGSVTFMTTYFVEFRGLSETVASLVFGLGPFIGIVGSLWGGYLAERTSAKKALSLAILGSAVMLSLLSMVSALSYLILCYVLYAFFNSTVWSPINALVAHLTPASERGLSYSIYFFTEGLLASVAPTLAAGAIELTNIWFVMPFSVAFLLSSIVILQFLPYPRRKQFLSR